MARTEGQERSRSHISILTDEGNRSAYNLSKKIFPSKKSTKAEASSLLTRQSFDRFVDPLTLSQPVRRWLFPFAGSTLGRPDPEFLYFCPPPPPPQPFRSPSPLQDIPTDQELETTKIEREIPALSSLGPLVVYLFLPVVSPVFPRSQFPFSNFSL